MARKQSGRSFELVHPHCAGIGIGIDIDIGIGIGSREHWVAVSRDHEQPVRSFSTFTDDLIQLADWLAELNVKVVAMEATGVYWIPLFELLDSRGFEVYLVNSRATRQISGRKSDVLDCQWIWQLMSHGLLRGAFRPADMICSVRALVRQRAIKVRDQSQALNRMQKALTQMNIQLANVISEISGVTGMRILRAIIAGERDPNTLDTSCAIKTTAHQLARLIYAMLTKGQPYVEQGIEAFEEQSKDRQLRALERKARKMGMVLVKVA